MLSWLVAAAVDRFQMDGKFFIFLTSQSYILLTLSLLLLAGLTTGYAALSRPNRGNGRSHRPTPGPTHNFGWYFQLSWFLYTSACVLALGVTFTYWLLLCTLSKSRSNPCNATTEAGCATLFNSTSEPSCQPNPTNLHLHGVNAIVVILDIWMSRVPFRLLHCFNSIVFSAFYLVFSLIYWLAHDRTEAGVIYSVLDYSDKKLTSVAYATLLLLMPPLFYLVLFAVAKARDATCRRLEYISRFNSSIYSADSEEASGLIGRERVGK
eukprot:Em0021g396a